ncbi:MAG TPA: glycosyltransferase [Ilumatobacteraceae bacterium]|nr:glycosyltransferase [Ilumatobacteraceae bacterium]
MTSPSVAVCVISYDAADTIETCVRSVAAVPNATVLVREHSAHTTALRTAEQAAADVGVPVIASHDPSNPGFAAGMNSLAASTDADWLFLLNPDADILSWPWSDEVRPATNTVYGAVQQDQHGQRVPAYGRRYRVVDELARSWFRRIQPPRDGIGFVGGAGLLIERTLFERLGGFDERFFLFYEDIDLCLRATALDASVELRADLVIHHETGTSARKNWDLALNASYESARYFHAKHGHSRRGYDLYVTADSLGRFAADALRRRTERRATYAKLARRALTNAVSPRPRP